MAYEVVTCQKCGGSSKFFYHSGIVGRCYSCNSSGKLKCYASKSYAISINNETGNPFLWIHVNARSEAEAKNKARKTGKNGCYKDRLDSIVATEDGVEYTYKPL